MQKFTRALTREIEVGGERLAVTLAEDGVTIRPVGPRRPPHQMGWAAVVCAVTGKLPAGAAPTKEEIDEALAALKAGASTTPAAHKAVAPPAAHAAVVSEIPATPAAGVPSLLARLDAWLAKHRQRY